MYHHKTGVWLRKIERTDLTDLKNLKNESWWGTHNTLLINDEDQIKWFENLSSKDLFLIVMHDDCKLGVLSFTNIDFVGRVCHGSGSGFRTATKNNFAEIAWYCGIDFAFEILNMHRIEAEVMAYNIPAQKLNIEAIGMKIEGIKRSAIYKSGRYYDSIMLGLLRSEWEACERVVNYGASCNTDFDHEKIERLIERSNYV